MHKLLSLVSTALLIPSVLLGQAREYEPTQQWPGINRTADGVEYEETKELLAILVSSSWCGGNSVDGFDRAIREMKNALAARADSLGYAFSAIGVAVDWDVSTGVDYLLEGNSTSGQLSFGPWAEIVAGRDWLNSANSLYVLPRGVRWLAVPHVFVVERFVLPTADYPELGTPRLLFRISGGEDIVEWAATGWEIPNLPYDPDVRPEPGQVR